MQNAFKHREAWLHALMERLRPLFEATGCPIPPNIRLSCGFPSRRSVSVKSRAVGECWPNTASKDGHYEIMVSPVVEEPMRVAGILAHELIHAAVGLKWGHRAPFSTVARIIGLEGRMSATVEGETFKRSVAPILDALGPYPHAELRAGLSSRPKKQTTRLIKCECRHQSLDGRCGYTVWVTRKWLDVSPPLCPRRGHGAMAVAKK